MCCGASSSSSSHGGETKDSEAPKDSAGAAAPGEARRVPSSRQEGEPKEGEASDVDEAATAGVATPTSPKVATLTAASQRCSFLDEPLQLDQDAPYDLEEPYDAEAPAPTVRHKYDEGPPHSWGKASVVALYEAVSISLAIAVVVALNIVANDGHLLLMIPSFAATVSNLIAALAGVSARKAFQHHAIWAACGTAVGVTIFFNNLTGLQLHPPAGATALIAVIGSDAIQDLGYLFVVFPVLVGSLLLIACALVFNSKRIRGGPGYPIYW